MKTEKFTATNAAMLLIDHQVGTLSWCQNIPQELIRNNTRALARTAHPAPGAQTVELARCGRLAYSPIAAASSVAENAALASSAAGMPNGSAMAPTEIGASVLAA